MWYFKTNKLQLSNTITLKLYLKLELQIYNSPISKIIKYIFPLYQNKLYNQYEPKFNSKFNVEIIYLKFF